MFWKKKQFWGTLIAVGLLAFCFKDIRLADIKTLGTRIDLYFLIPSIVCAFIFIATKGMRWRLMINTQKPITFYRALSLYSAGQILNIVMPMLTGQVGRMFLFSKNEGLKKTFIFSTIVLEILFDSISLLIFLLLTSLAFVVPEEYRSAGYVIGGVTFVVIALLYLLLIFQHKIENFSKRKFRGRWPGFYISLQKFIRSFVQGINMLRSSKHAIVCLIYSLLSWLFHTLVVYFLLKSFGFTNINYITTSASIMIINTLALMVPISPGNAGTFEFAVSTTLTAFKVGRTDAVLFALALHLLDFLPIAILGYTYLHTEKISLSEIKQEHEDDELFESVSEDGVYIEKEEQS